MFRQDKRGQIAGQDLSELAFIKSETEFRIIALR